MYRKLESVKSIFTEIGNDSYKEFFESAPKFSEKKSKIAGHALEAASTVAYLISGSNANMALAAYNGARLLTRKGKEKNLNKVLGAVDIGVGLCALAAGAFNFAAGDANALLPTASISAGAILEGMSEFYHVFSEEAPLEKTNYNEKIKAHLAAAKNGIEHDDYTFAEFNIKEAKRYAKEGKMLIPSCKLKAMEEAMKK